MMPIDEEIMVQTCLNDLEFVFYYYYYYYYYSFRKMCKKSPSIVPDIPLTLRTFFRFK